jgi:leucyl/phenylalanyl-tRNA--protein transferase
VEPGPAHGALSGEFRISRSLRRRLRAGRFEVRLDSDFLAVMRACAEVPRAAQEGTWITREMLRAYWELHQIGIAHSVETWVEGKLVGGLYGLALGGMFYGESMFSRSPTLRRSLPLTSPVTLEKRASA